MLPSTRRPVRARAAVSAVAITAALLPGCGPHTSPQPIRLLEASAGVFIEWPNLEGTAPPRLDPVEIHGFPERGRLVRVQIQQPQIGNDTRIAMLAPSGSLHRFPLQVPGRAVLRIGLSAVPPAEGTAVSELRFVGRVRRGGREPVVIFDEIRSAADAPGWKDLEVPLGRWAGKDIQLELSVDGPAGAPRAWGLLGAPEVASLAGTAEGYNLVLISLDTLRADHLGCYGYSRPTSPRIDRFAAQSVRFSKAVSQSPWTRPSHRAMLTGLYPISDAGYATDALPRVLWRAGYRTLGLTGGGQLDHRFGFSAGFEIYRTFDWMAAPGELDAWLERAGARKSFLFLHSYEIHDPYRQPRFTAGIDCGRVGHHFAKADADRLRHRLTDEEKRCVEALYDGDIAHADERLGDFLDALDRSGVGARSIVVLTSDHGEQFWEHGSWRHGMNMYDHQLLVPLIIRLPDGLKRSLEAASGKPLPSVVDDVVRVVDIYPTLVDLLDLPATHPVQGRSLRPLLEGRKLPELDAFAENTNTGKEKKALRSRQFKFVLSLPRRGERQAGQTEEQLELYDLGRDPGEQTDIAGERPELVRALHSRINAIREGRRDAALDSELPADVTPELREQLKSLGYLGD